MPSSIVSDVKDDIVPHPLVLAKVVFSKQVKVLGSNSKKTKTVKEMKTKQFSHELKDTEDSYHTLLKTILSKRP